MGQAQLARRNGPSSYAAAGSGRQAKTRSVTDALAVFEARDPLDHGLGRIERDPGKVLPVVEPRPEQAVQVDDVIGMVVRHDDRVESGGRGGAEVREQPRQGSVAEVEHDPEPGVLEQEAAARATRLGPRAAAAEHHQAARHRVGSRLNRRLAQR